MQLLTPRNLEESLALLSKHANVRPIAGGTDLLVSWHHHAKDDWTLLDLTPLADELQYTRLTDDALELGALATYWDAIVSDEITAAFPLLRDAARQIGAIQIQTRGTWAGNIANGSPAADGVPVMMAYDAVVILQSTRGRREVPLDSYYTGYRQSVRESDELIVAIRLPRRERNFEWFHKVGPRAAQAITKVGVAVVHDSAGWRVVTNSVAATVCRCPALEDALETGSGFQSLDQIRKLLETDIAPIDDVRSTAAYRSTVLTRLLWHKFAQPAVNGE